MDINFIETDIRDVINEDCLDINFGRYLFVSWWTSLQHGLSQVGSCAPLTVVKSIKTLLFASALTPEYKRPSGSCLYMNNNISWGDTNIIYDEFNLSRQDKIRKVLKNYIIDTQQYPTLRVCYSQFRELNCDHCEKCLRTITGLVLENVDPNKCGFRISDKFFNFFKKRLIKEKKHLIQWKYNIAIWNDIQKHIPGKINHNLHNSKEFFRWLKEFNLPINGDPKRPNFIWELGRIYCKLPKSIQILLKKLDRIFNRH